MARKYFANLVRDSAEIGRTVEAVDLDGPAPVHHHHPPSLHGSLSSSFASGSGVLVMGLTMVLAMMVVMGMVEVEMEVGQDHQVTLLHICKVQYDIVY